MVHSEIMLPAIVTSKSKVKHFSVKSNYELSKRRHSTKCPPNTSISSLLGSFTSLYRLNHSDSALTNKTVPVLLPPTAVQFQPVSVEDIKSRLNVTSSKGCQKIPSKNIPYNSITVLNSGVTTHPVTRNCFTLPQIKQSDKKQDCNVVLPNLSLKGSSLGTSRITQQQLDSVRNSQSVYQESNKNIFSDISMEMVNVDQSQLKLKLLDNIRKFQTGADCCSVINLRIPLSSVSSRQKSNIVGNLQEFVPSETQVNISRKLSPYSKGFSYQDIRLRCNAWEKKNKQEQRKFKKGSNDHPPDKLSSALDKLKDVVYSRACNYRTECELSMEKLRKLNKHTNCHLSIVDFKRQAALLPEPQNHVHHTSLTSVTSQMSSSMSSTDSYENSSVTNSPGVSHHASLAMGIASGISVQSKNSQLNIRDCFFNVSNKSTEYPLSGGTHCWKQLPPPPMTNRLSYLRRNAASGNGPLSSGNTTPQDSPLHHSAQPDLLIEGTHGGIISNEGHEYEPKHTWREQMVIDHQTVKKDTETTAVLPPLLKNNSLKVSSAKLHQVTRCSSLNSTPSHHSHKKSQHSLQAKRKDIKDTSKEYSYLDPLSGASNRFQWRLNKLQDHECVTMRKEKKTSKKQHKTASL